MLRIRREKRIPRVSRLWTSEPSPGSRHRNATPPDSWLHTNPAQANTALLVAQRHHGIRLGGTAGRKVTVGERDHRQQSCDSGKRSGYNVIILSA